MVPIIMDCLVTGTIAVLRSTYGFICTKISTLKSFHGNVKSLQNELEKLTSLKNDVEESIELAKREGKSSTAQVNAWLKQVEELQRDINPLLEESLPEEESVGERKCFNCKMRDRYRLSKELFKKIEDVKLLLDSYNLLVIVHDKKSPILAVQRILAPSLGDQTQAMETIQRLLQVLNDDAVRRIAVWGMGGVGKTTLVKNLNNALESSPMEESFDMVIWINVSKDLDLRRIQSEIAERLDLAFEQGESMQRRANRVLRRLMARKKFLFIFDDVWEQIDLEMLGIPQNDHEEDIKCKILLTTRDFVVCRKMMTDIEIKVDVLSDEAAWSLFAQSAGKVVQSDGIEPLARKIAKKCCGLPLAIKTVGKSMRSKTMMKLWENTLCQLRRPESHCECIEKEVYLPLKLSYDSLQNKILQWCFLYCSLYPENFSIAINDLIYCLLADGLINKNQTLEEIFNNGVALIETLKESCLLEHGDTDRTVKMHGVLRDVAIRISSTEKEHGFFSQSGLSSGEMAEHPHTSAIRVSYMKSSITRLPSSLLGCSELTVLFLQGNPIKKIPYGFFQETRRLKYLNLSNTLITSLPLSLLQVNELRALLLTNCYSLEELPPLGNTLHKLQILDLSGTRLKELPKETWKLVNLRELNLSRTHHLEYIEPGSVARLGRLEVLDVSFSAYKWDLKCNIEGKAAFDELLSLKNLSVLHIRLDAVDHFEFSFAWLKRLRRFSIRVGPRSCNQNYLPIHDDEKRVLLSRVDLLDKGIEGLICSASSLDLIHCGGISGFSEVVLKNNWCNLKNLTSLTITSCDSMENLISGEIQHAILPNLERLTLTCLKNLVAIFNKEDSNGRCFGRLKTIEVHDCPKLKNLISYALLPQLQNLEEIKVSGCAKMTSIVAGKVSTRALSKLKDVELRDLTSLRTICSRRSIWPALSKIEVSNCPSLRKLPLSIYNAGTVKEIRGDLKWWNKLRWEDENIKTSLVNMFQARADQAPFENEDIRASI